MATAEQWMALAKSNLEAAGALGAKFPAPSVSRSDLPGALRAALGRSSSPVAPSAPIVCQQIFESCYKRRLIADYDPRFATDARVSEDTRRLAARIVNIAERIIG